MREDNLTLENFSFFFKLKTLNVSSDELNQGVTVAVGYGQS